MLWEFSTEQWLTSFAFICCVSYICGWIADRILGYAGFSVLGNWLLLLIGAYVGLFCLNMYGMRIYWDSMLVMYVTFGSALVMLFIMLSIRAVLHI
jgi:uncharacterized membrane protein YeaQ/YmgE (transglycosylase-associated protein family)